MNLSLNDKSSLFASFYASSKAAFRTQRAQFLPFRLRQSPYNRRSQVDPYCINTDQLAKPAVVDSTELSRQPKRQKLRSLSTWPTSPSMSYEAALKSAKKYIKNQNFSIKE
jgi:hypothetical protein